VQWAEALLLCGDLWNGKSQPRKHLFTLLTSQNCLSETSQPPQNLASFYNGSLENTRRNTPSWAGINPRVNAIPLGPTGEAERELGSDSAPLCCLWMTPVPFAARQTLGRGHLPALTPL